VSGRWVLGRAAALEPGLLVCSSASWSDSVAATADEVLANGGEIVRADRRGRTRAHREVPRPCGEPSSASTRNPVTRRIGINRVLIRHTRVMPDRSGDRGAVAWSTDLPPRLGLVSGLCWVRLVSGLLPTGSDRCCMFPWLAPGHASSLGRVSAACGGVSGRCAAPPRDNCSAAA
jgi:hypothetical protein